jgi:hypothetical protein
VTSEAAAETPATRDMVMSYLLLRIFVGVIGIVLPWLLIVGNWVIGYGFQPSMSGYYYTPMRNFFVGALWALGIFLVAYNGYDLADRMITNVAGVATIGVSLLPTTPANNPTLRQVVIGDLHLTCACVAFVLLAVMALRFAKRVPTPPGLRFWPGVGYAFGFTRAADSGTPRWEIVVYRFSGFVILGCVLLIYPLANVATYSLLTLETIMLVFFGLSWFVKGRKLLAGG